MLEAGSRRYNIPVLSFSMGGNCFIANLLVRCCLITDGKASADGVVVHLEERQQEVWVDTHVYRTAHRLGLIGPKVTANQAHTVFAKITPPEWVYPLHVNLIRHGRQICLAQRPRCAQCPLYSECVYVGSVSPEEAAVSG
jgi:adenine-specific DNA glycosylase